MRSTTPVVLLLLIGLSACGDGASADDGALSRADITSADFGHHEVKGVDLTPAAPTPEAIERITVSLSAEPKVKDVHYSGAGAALWDVAVIDDGTRRDGLAESLCLTIAEQPGHAPGERVRVVDHAAVSDGKSPRDAVLGEAHCATE